MSQPSTTPDRPAQVTVAGWMIIIGSVFVVVLVWDRIAGLHSLESRRAFQSMLTKPGIKDSGLQVADLMTLVRVMSMVAAGCATAMVVLGYQALHRSRVARTLLTVLAVPLFVCGLAVGAYVSSFVAAAVATLWLGPARAWFQGLSPAGVGSRAMPSLPGHAVRPGTPAQHHPTGGHPSPPTQPASRPDVWAPPPVSIYDARPSAGFGAALPARPAGRPSTVLWACLVTWVFSGFTALMLVGSMLVLAADSTTVLRRMHEQNPDLATQGISDHTILVVSYVVCALLLVWSLAAAVCAVLVFRRVRWAWYALAVSTAGVGALCLLGAIGSLFALVPLAAAGATMALLVRPETRRWFG